MIKLQTNVKLGDNSGVKSAKCLQIYGKLSGSINDIILITVKNVKVQSKIKKGDLYKAIIIRVKKKIHRLNGNTIHFKDNSVVLINKKDELYGTRIFGPIGCELRKKKFVKLLSLAYIII